MKKNSKLKKNKKKIINKDNKFIKRFNLFKNIFIFNSYKNIFYNLKSNIYGINSYKLNFLFFLSNFFNYIYINKLNKYNLIGIKFCFSSLFLCFNKELYKKKLLLIKKIRNIKK
uniref:Uncharacterized protein n=1 Tax=Babesia rodhaini TaxID=5870 RepID=A0A455QZ72_BABRO|nr:hypothetical protein [Babesia rodhaini]